MYVGNRKLKPVDRSKLIYTHWRIDKTGCGCILGQTFDLKTEDSPFLARDFGNLTQNEVDELGDIAVQLFKNNSREKRNQLETRAKELLPGLEFVGEYPGRN
jgi:hypothetical protein